MYTANREHWSNGYQKRGGTYTPGHRSLAFQVFNIGFIATLFGKRILLSVFRLV